MNKFSLPLLILSSLMILSINLFAQYNVERADKLYTMSSVGFSFPVGETADYLKPKFSSTLGLNLGIGNGGLFLYPKVSLHAYSYNELSTLPGYNFALQKGRATTYLLNVALGYRKTVGKLSYYGFAGGGGGVILTPRIEVNNLNQQATLSNKNNGMAILETGAGLEYNIGGAVLFAEASYMHGFSKIQNRSYNVAPLTVGLKPNLSKLLRKIIN